MSTRPPLDIQAATNNARIAERLREMANLSRARDDQPFRAQAYRRAARTIESLPRSVTDLLRREGLEALERLPTIGKGIAAAIAELVRTGRWSALEELRQEVGGAPMFASLPGIGPELAQRLSRELGVASLEELEDAVHDGRVRKVPGFGPARTAMLRAELEERLRRVRRRARPMREPALKTLLDVDREYRRRAAVGDLPTIAPRRFNPEHEAWLPVLRTRRGDWRFTALYSNTATAHRAHRTDDWVVIYFRDRSGREGQRTVVTETRGPKAGQRVVRGRARSSSATATATA